MVPLPHAVNQKVDPLIGTGDLTDEQKRTLRDKTIKIPAQGAATSGNRRAALLGLTGLFYPTRMNRYSPKIWGA